MDKVLAQFDSDAGQFAEEANLPLVSVIIPARDAEHTLAVALQSLIAQTIPDWQAIIVNDGSDEGTARVISEHVDLDKRISGRPSSGAGVSAARNLGLEAARGRWILFLDADDWIDPHFLERMLAALQVCPDAVAAYCGSRRVSPEGQMGKAVNDAELGRNPFGLLSRYNAVAIHAVLVDRKAVQAAGGFDPTLRTCEDWDLWQRIARLGGPWIQVPETMSYYLMRPGSLTRDLPQLLADAESVIRRGFAQDARVSVADQASADGEDAAGEDEALSKVFLWFGTVEALRGADGEPALRKLAALPPLATHVAEGVITDAISTALLGEPEDLADQWPTFGPPLIGWLKQVGAISGRPGEARNLQYRIEKWIIQSADPSKTIALDLTLGLALDAEATGPIVHPRGNIDRLLVSVPSWPRSSMDLGLLGDISRAELISAALPRIGWKRSMRLAASSLWPRSIPLVSRKLAAAAARHPSRLVRRSGLKQIIHEACAEALADAVRRDRPQTGHSAALDALKREAEVIASKEMDARPGTAERGVDWNSIRTDGSRETYWDDVFRKEDPWNYASPYEQEKYNRQMDMLPGGFAGTALELACAEGRFTRLLAQRAARVIATDISGKALERAEARCDGLDNITFQKHDLIADELPAELDLIVCSEVLFYTEGVAELEKVAGRLASALKPGGHIVTAHARVLTDDPGRTGFDWGSHPFGADVIARVLSGTPGLALERSMDCELYRIDRYIRIDAPGAPEPTIERVAIEAPIDMAVRRYIVWDGAVITRQEVQSESRSRIPVLMYHRIAEDGPEALRPYRVTPEMFCEQVRWLRRNGYHTVVSQDLPQYFCQQNFRGRPVMISFDDGFQDFADLAWPVLHDHDLIPEVFIVSDLIGKTSEWDAKMEGEFPLMDKSTLGRLRDEGVHFGSHLASHRAPAGLSTRELAAELVRSRAMIGKWLGTTPQSFAAPFGSTDERVQRLAAECGYSVGFGTHDGCASAESNLLNLPRIQVGGDWKIDRFVETLESYL